MQINMSDSLINNVTQLKEFLKGSKRFDPDFCKLVRHANII